MKAREVEIVLDVTPTWWSTTPDMIGKYIAAVLKDGTVCEAHATRQRLMVTLAAPPDDMTVAGLRELREKIKALLDALKE